MKRTKEEFEKEFNKLKEEICPVCGYYCLGKGVFGCIDKLGMIKAFAKGNKPKV